MRKSKRGITLTELLTVVSVLTIMTSFVTPVIISVKHSAMARVCSNNIRQIYMALQLYANNQYGRFPGCFEINAPASGPVLTSDYGVWENSWWYRKVSALLYPGKDPLASPANFLPPEQFALRCPATMDSYNDYYAAGWYPKVSTGSDSDKDRAFDDNYGYTNFGFRYGAGHNAQPAVVNPDTLNWGTLTTSKYYHAAGGWGAIVGRPTHLKKTVTTCDCGNPWPCIYTSLGQFSKVSEGARTILMMDYVKADVAPEFVNDGLWGYRFRHGGRANVLFADGHISLYSRQSFLADLGTPDPTTTRTRIHWSVLRP